MSISLPDSLSRLEIQEPVAVAPLQEIFSSVQGEGVYVGKRQIFVRFAHCHLHCAYCDTPMTTPTGKCHVETVPGKGELAYLENPMKAEELLDVLVPLSAQARHHSISFTGGEPLLYHRFLRQVFPRVQELGLKTYLETSGTQPQFLAEVLPWCDIIAMDIKLPSSTRENDQFTNHAEFYRVSKSSPQAEIFIKVVFNGETTLDEMDAVKAIVTDRKTPIILQPETSLPDPANPDAPLRLKSTPQQMFRLENYLSEVFDDVRVIPQTHKMMKVL